MKISQALTEKYGEQIKFRQESFEDEEGFLRTCGITDLTNLNQRDTYETYSNIGHEDNPENILWLYRGNKMLTHKAGPEIYHHTVWSVDNFKTDFRGRVTKDKSGSTVVTLFRPMSYSPDKEQEVIRKLMVEFSPSDIQVFG